jgi:hypothetical protein
MSTAYNVKRKTVPKNLLQVHINSQFTAALKNLTNVWGPPSGYHSKVKLLEIQELCKETKCTWDWIPTNIITKTLTKS